MYERLIERWERINEENYQNVISTKKVLHENSKELMDTLSKYSLGNSPNVLEIGCGSGRNIQYITKSFPNSKVYGNDLSKSACFKYMDKKLAEKIHFYEEDTLSFMKSHCFPLNLLLSSDHLMHLDKKTVREIIFLIQNKWKPKKILLRELSYSKINRKKSKKPKWAHNFYKLDLGYKLLENYKSEQDSRYRITLWKRK